LDFKNVRKYRTRGKTGTGNKQNISDEENTSTKSTLGHKFQDPEIRKNQNFGNS
jgi:hypothetical protein